MNRGHEARQALRSHRALLAAQERERVAELIRRQDEHIAREEATKAEKAYDQEN